ncbi:MAG TPA: GTPase [Candidatus Sulfotelmatobacter sp.]|nr:GTPase [Candidatus Sulfotelmatobacter sp.]
MDLEKKIKNYRTPDSAKDIIKKTKIVLLVGPSGVGKTSLKQKILATGKFHHLVSHTTRKPRYNHGILEKDGQEYYFVDRPTLEKMLDNHELVEAKYYSGNIYATSIAEIQKANKENKTAVTDIEIQGVGEYKGVDKNVLAIYILPPDFDTWQKRIDIRYGDKVDVSDYVRRLKTAKDELNQLLTTNDYVAVINDDLNRVTQETLNIIDSFPDHPADDHRARKLAKKLQKDIDSYLKTTN